MAATAAIIGAITAVGSTAYSAISANQQSQKNKGTLADANAPLPKTPNLQQEEGIASQAGAKAAAASGSAAGKSAGFAGTILTGPNSTLTSTTGPQRKTLLGL